MSSVVLFAPLLQTAWPYFLIDEVYTWQVTAKFKCIVRIIAIYPLQAKDFRSPEGTYRVRLCLEDPTARIHALLYAEDGVRFLLPFVLHNLYYKHSGNVYFRLTEYLEERKIDGLVPFYSLLLKCLICILKELGRKLCIWFLFGWRMEEIVSVARDS